MHDEEYCELCKKSFPESELLETSPHSFYICEKCKEENGYETCDMCSRESKVLSGPSKFGYICEECQAE